MQADDLRLLFAYNYWAHARILKAAANLSHEQFITPGAATGLGSVRDTLVHILGAEHVWRRRCQEGASPASLPTTDDFPTLAALAVAWQSEEAAMRAFLASLDDTALDHMVHYRTTKGVAMQNTLWHILTHVLHHGTQHRSEVAILLTTYGHSPGDLDFILYLRERPGA